MNTIIRQYKFLLIGLVLLILLGLVFLFFNGFDSSLPLKLTYKNRSYISSGRCWTEEKLTQNALWPLKQMTVVKAFNISYPVFLPETNRLETPTTLIALDNNCYVPFGLEGGP